MNFTEIANNRQSCRNYDAEREVEKEGKIFVNGKFNEGFEPYFREEIN